jgi:hypothetical protein
MYYKRKDIKSIEDLPKEGIIHVGNKYSFEELIYIENGETNKPFRFDKYDEPILSINSIAWFLLPCDDYVQALEELVGVQKELLDMTYDKNVIWDNTKAMELRQRIETLTKKL